jgi:hypothetical protein
MAYQHLKSRTLIVISVCILAVAISFGFLFKVSAKEGFDNNLAHVNNICGGGPNSKLLPVHSAIFNMREIVKQMILLEDHLFQKEKLCKECINKHFLAIEGYAEEGITLGSSKETGQLCDQFETVIKIIRSAQASFNENREQAHEVAMKIRTLRKEIMHAYQLTVNS